MLQNEEIKDLMICMDKLSHVGIKCHKTALTRALISAFCSDYICRIKAVM